MYTTNKWNNCFTTLALSIILGFGFVTTSFAEPHGKHSADSHGKNMNSGHHKEKSAKHSKKSSKGGTFSPHWVKTLSDEQKVSFDKMHLMVGQFEAVNTAKLKMLNAELGVLTAKDSSNQSAIYAKIDEIMTVKKSIMRNRFDHIVEMRNELTDQQHISYDMGLLKRGKHKH